MEPACKPIKNRQENIEAAGVLRMMEQVVPRRRAQPLRQPAAHVGAPMNFFKCNVVNREAREYPGGPAIAENPLEKEKWRRVGEKKRDDSPGIPGKVDVPGHLRRIQRLVVHHVLLAKEAAARVQYESMQAILKGVGVKKSQHETTEDPTDGMRKQPDGNPYEDGPGQNRSQEIVPLDSQSLCFACSPNIAFGKHLTNKVARSKGACKPPIPSGHILGRILRLAHLHEQQDQQSRQ